MQNALRGCRVGCATVNLGVCVGGGGGSYDSKRVAGRLGGRYSNQPVQGGGRGETNQSASRLGEGAGHGSELRSPMATLVTGSGGVGPHQRERSSSSSTLRAVSACFWSSALRSRARCSLPSLNSVS